MMMAHELQSARLQDLLARRLTRQPIHLVFDRNIGSVSLCNTLDVAIQNCGSLYRMCSVTASLRCQLDDDAKERVQVPGLAAIGKS
jgi:hypothetical protein